VALQILAPNSDTETILKVMDRDGAAIIADILPDSKRTRFSDEVMPHINATPMGPDEFTGVHTQRTGALVARSPTCREIILNKTIVDSARSFLAPFTERMILHLTQTIYIHPDQSAQILHRDRLAWGPYIPREIEPQFNTMWAMTDFTAANGATRVVPGSHKWDWDKRAEPHEFCQAEMPAGSVLLYTGSVLHSGGKNESTDPRLGLNITYCLGWLRQEENQYLSCPPHIAKDLDPELQELLGYTQGSYALGYFSDPASTSQNSDILPPEAVLGRRPRKGQGFSLSDSSELGPTSAQLQEITQQH